MIQHIYGRKPPRVVIFRVIPSCFCHRAAEISFSMFFNETGNKKRSHKRRSGAIFKTIKTPISKKATARTLFRSTRNTQIARVITICEHKCRFASSRVRHCYISTTRFSFQIYYHPVQVVGTISGHGFFGG